MVVESANSDDKHDDQPGVADESSVDGQSLVEDAATAAEDAAAEGDVSVARPVVADSAPPAEDVAVDVAGDEEVAEDAGEELEEDSDEALGHVEPIEEITEEEGEEDLKTDWYILKVAVNRENTVRDSLERRVKVAGLERFFGDIVVPTEDVAEFTKTGKRRVVKRKLFPGYIVVDMAINDDTWFLVRETSGIGDFTGSAGKPTPMEPHEIDRILRASGVVEDDEAEVKTAIPFNVADRVRVKEGHFQNFEGEVESIDEANGRVTVMLSIFGRSTPVEIEHWQIESV